MSESDIEALLRAARRVAGGEPLTSELMGQEGVPVPLRLVVAFVALTAADQPASKSAILTAAPAARSATYRAHSQLLEACQEVLPALVKAQLALIGVKVTASDLANQLQDANHAIRTERTRRERAEARRRAPARGARQAARTARGDCPAQPVSQHAQ